MNTEDYEAGVRDGRATEESNGQTGYDQDLFTSDDYRRGLSAGRAAVIDERLGREAGQRGPWTWPASVDDPAATVDELGGIWSPDFAAYAVGELHASQIRCALCQHAPCDCPPFGSPEYFALVDERHGKNRHAQ